jgi:glycosyltransferase involved in cell wall biosynthesis
MKLLMINYEYPPLGGGAGQATANLAAEFAGMGVTVDVLTSAYKGLPAHERAKGFFVHRAPDIRRHLHRSSIPEMMTFTAGAMMSSLKLAGRKKPDAVLAFFGIPSGPVAYGLKVLFGIPYFVSLRGGDVPGFQPYDLKLYHFFAGPVIREIWARAAGVVGNSRGLSKMARHFSPSCPVKTIPNGVDTELFAPFEDPSTDDRCRVLFVGRLTYQKGLDVLVEALHGMAAHVRPCVILAGEGNARVGLERKVKGLALEDDVLFAGWHDRHEIPELYKKADIFVLPSRHEGMSNALLEAMAAGLPVIATDIAGSEELVSHGENGLLVPVEDVPALSGALARLVTDPSLRKRMGAAGRKRIVDRYSWKRIAQEYLEWIERSISLKKKGQA